MSAGFEESGVLWWLSVLGLSILAIVALAAPPDAAPALRLVMLLGFALWVPGAVVVGAVAGIDRAAKMAVTPGVSLALVLLVVTTSLKVSHWEPTELLFAGAELSGFVALFGLGFCLASTP